MQQATTRTYFMVVSHFHKTADGEIIVDSWFSEYFDTLQAAKEWFDKNVKTRKKGDEYDEHYNKMEFLAEQRIETKVLISF